MKTRSTLLSFLILFLCSFLSIQLQSQLLVDVTQTPEQLVQSLIGQGVSFSNVTYDGNTNAIGAFSNGSSTNLGLDGGVVLSSGNVMDVPNPASILLSSNNGQPGDPDLNILAGVNTYDAAVLEFDFIPVGDSLYFEYVFGSEEYPEYVGASFYDVFGFYITGPKPDGAQYQHENVALVPGTQSPISVNTINHQTNPQYYIDNQNGLTIGYDGFTVILQIALAVVPFQSYHIKIAIADGMDQIYDSGVFLGANSFRSPSSYFPLVEDEKEWDDLMVMFNAPSPWDTTYYTFQTKFEGDTIIDDVNYFKVYRYNPIGSYGWYYMGAIREDESRKVYIHSGEEFLKYDFGVGLGDTFEIFEYSYPIDLIVDAVDSVFVNGEYRRRLYLIYVEYSAFTETWIEGIGSNRGVMGSGTAGVVGGWTRFLCMHLMGELIYMNPNYTSCNLTNVSIRELDEAEVRIYPNPADDHIIIEFSDESKITSAIFYDKSGRKVLEISPSGNELDVSSLSPGLYLLKLSTGNNYVTKKVIIK